MKSSDCPICQNEAIYYLKKDKYKLYKCTKCKLVYVYPQPTTSQLKKLYSTETGYQSNKDSDLTKRQERKNDIKILEYLLKSKKGTKLLDVGCSDGQFLYAAKKRGFKTFGIELNRGTAENAQKNGLNVEVGTIESSKFPKKSFDVIFLGDVIEHVVNPEGFVNSCLKFLKNDGILVVSTPNLDCFWANSTYLFYKLFSIPWSSVTPPYHLFQFSINNLDNLMSKTGLKRINFWYNSPPPLSYELWFTGLPAKYVKNRNFVNFLRYYSTYLIYAFFYALNKPIAKLFNKDNGMVAIYKK